MEADIRKRHANEWWWLGVIEGILIILFGIAALFWPGLTLLILIYIFSIYVIVDGITAIIRSLTGERGLKGLWWLRLVYGIFALGVGVYLIRHPGVSFATIILLIGFVFVVRGVIDIVAGIFARMPAGGRVLEILVGILGLLAGIIVLRQPVASGVAFVWIIGLFALIKGPLVIVHSVEERNEHERLTIEKA